jgi:beta-glucosidase
MTDWFGLHGGYAAIEAGLDMAMPDGGSLWGPMGANISEAIKNGSFPEARLDDQATRLVKNA